MPCSYTTKDPTATLGIAPIFVKQQVHRFISTLLGVFFCVCTVSSAQAQAVNITGGTCIVSFAALGPQRVHLVECANLTRSKADDLHLEFMYPGLPNKPFDFEFPEIEPNAVWQAPEDTVIWGGAEIESIGGAGTFDENNLSASGYWTLEDRMIPAIPEPDTWAMMLLGFGVVGAMARRRGFHKLTVKHV